MIALEVEQNCFKATQFSRVNSDLLADLKIRPRLTRTKRCPGSIRSPESTSNEASRWATATKLPEARGLLPYGQFSCQRQVFTKSPEPTALPSEAAENREVLGAAHISLGAIIAEGARREKRRALLLQTHSGILGKLSSTAGCTHKLHKLNQLSRALWP